MVNQPSAFAESGYIGRRRSEIVDRPLQCPTFPAFEVSVLTRHFEQLAGGLVVFYQQLIYIQAVQQFVDFQGSLSRLPFRRTSRFRPKWFGKKENFCSRQLLDCFCGLMAYHHSYPHHTAKRANRQSTYPRIRCIVEFEKPAQVVSCQLRTLDGFVRTCLRRLLRSCRALGILYGKIYKKSNFFFLQRTFPDRLKLIFIGGLLGPSSHVARNAQQNHY